MKLIIKWPSKFLIKIENWIFKLSRPQRNILAISLPLILLLITFPIAEWAFYKNFFHQGDEWVFWQNYSDDNYTSHLHHFGFTRNWWVWVIFVALVGIIEFKLFEQKKEVQRSIMKNITKISVKLILTVLFLCCLLDMPYGYFQFVRFLGMAGFILFAYFDSEKEYKALMIVWICSAILINPIIKIPLGRTIWNIVDVIWAILLLHTLINDIIYLRKKNNS